jgi:peroxiredoxin
MTLFRRAYLLIFAVFAVGCGTVIEGFPTHEESSIVVVGDVAPDFTATLLGGESVTLAELRGEVVLLVLFSHECPDCKMFLDDMQASKSEFDELGVRILAIERDGNAEQVAAYMAENGYGFDVAVDENRAIYNLYATTYVPRAYLIDREGVVVCATIEYDASYIELLLSCVPR